MLNFPENNLSDSSCFMCLEMGELRHFDVQSSEMQIHLRNVEKYQNELDVTFVLYYKFLIV